MADLFINKDYVYCREIKLENSLNNSITHHNGLRVYQNSPETVHVQIRNTGSIVDGNPNAKSRNMIAGVNLNKQEIDILIEKLSQVKQNLS
jgi:hypothetical protein